MCEGGCCKGGTIPNLFPISRGCRGDEFIHIGRKKEALKTKLVCMHVLCNLHIGTRVKVEVLCGGGRRDASQNLPSGFDFKAM
jgi:hypothetical protein